MTDDFPPLAPMRPLWLVTLADLALLLLGFVVLVQATEHNGRHALAEGLRARFGSQPAPAASTAIPVSAFATSDFGTGSATLPSDPQPLVDWAREALADPRVALTVTGSADGSRADVDPASGSGTVLALDRTRAIVAALAAGRVATNRLSLATAIRPGARRVTITLAFAGELPRSPS